MNHHELRAFHEHITKVSAIPLRQTLTSAARRVGVGAGAMPGALVGAGVGALHGGLTAEDGSRGQGAITGALRGGLIGGAAGGFARGMRDQQLLAPGIGAGTAAQRTLGAGVTGVKNFAKRQVHGFTGAYKNDLGNIGMHSSQDSARKIHLERLRAADTVNHGGNMDAASLGERVKAKLQRRGARTRGDVAAQGLADREAGLVEQGARGDAAIRAGITSIPGVAKGLVTKPKETGKALWKATADSPMSAAMALGVPTAFAAPGILRGDESETGGLTRKQKLTRLGTELGAGLLTGGMSTLPQMATFTAAERLGDKLTGVRRGSGE